MAKGRFSSRTPTAVALVAALVLLAALLPMGRQPLAQCPADSIGLCGVTTVSSAPSYSVAGCAFNGAGANYNLVAGHLNAGAPNPGNDAFVTTWDVYSISGPDTPNPVQCSAILTVHGHVQCRGSVSAEIRSGIQAQEMTSPYGQGFGISYIQTLSLALEVTLGAPITLSLKLHALSPGGTCLGRVNSAGGYGDLSFSLPPGYIVTSCQGYSTSPTASRPSTWGRVKTIYR